MFTNFKIFPQWRENSFFLTLFFNIFLQIIVANARVRCTSATASNRLPWTCIFSTGANLIIRWQTQMPLIPSTAVKVRRLKMKAAQAMNTLLWHPLLSDLEQNNLFSYLTQTKTKIGYIRMLRCSTKYIFLSALYSSVVPC